MADGATLGKAYIQIIPSMEGTGSKISAFLNGEGVKAGNEAGVASGTSMMQSLKSTAVKLASTLAIGATIKQSVESAFDFQDSMAKMSTLFDTSKTKVSDLSKEFVELSNKTGMSASGLAEAGYQALSAGRSVEEVTGFVSTAADLAKAGFTSTTTAVDVLTTAMNAYGQNAGTAEEISNKLVRTQNLGKTTVDELASSMGKIIPTASAMGINIDNLTSGYVSLTKQGIATAESTTYMNSMLNELGDSGTTLGGVLEKRTGQSFQQLMASGMSLADVLQITKDYADENNIAYNELWGSAEAGKAGLAILNGGVEEFNNTVGTMASNTDDVGDALTKLQTPAETIHKAMNVMKNTFMTVAASVIELVTPAIQTVAGYMTDLGEKITSFANSSPAVAQAIITAIEAVLAMFVAFHAAKAVQGLPETIKGIGTAFNALAANPVAVVIAAIAGIAVVLINLYNTNEAFRNKVNEIWSYISTYISAAAEYIATNLGPVWDSILVKASEIWNNVLTTITTVWETIKPFVIDAVTVIAVTIGTAFEVIKAVISAAMYVIQNVIIPTWNDISRSVGSKVNEISAVISPVFNTISTVISTVWETIKTTTTTVWDGIKSAIEGPLTKAKDFIKGIIDTIKGFFNFNISWPHIPMPHFYINPRGWGIGDLLKGSIPSLGIDWYAKAMGEPRILEGAQIFGSMNGKLLGGGEAGQEVLYGRSQLMRDIAEATMAADRGGSISTLTALVSKIERIIALLEQYLPEGGDIYMDGELVSKKIEKLQNRKKKLNQKIEGIA